MPETKRPLKVFLCHASADKPIVRELYRRLVRDGVDVWMDETSLLPGMDWKLEIPRVVRIADAIIICLSNQSVTKEGYVQKEIRFALDAAEEKPDGTIYIIPVRLDACDIPSRLARWQWVDLFSSDGYRKLRISLRLRAEAIGATMSSTNRKTEMENFPARGNLEQSKPPKPEENKINFGYAGRLFAILAVVILACAGLFSAGRWMFSGDDQPPSQTPTLTPDPTPSSTPEATAATDTLTPFQPSVLPTETATLFIPSSTPTPIPTQTSTPTSVPPTPTAPMVLIPAGTFIMGDNTGNNDEHPAHSVYLDAFYIYKFEVTNLAYSHCVDSGVCKMPLPDGVPDNYYGSTTYQYHPVVNVSWEMAMTYCGWHSERLPTEAEWEKAARGGLQDMPFPWGIATPACEEDAINGARFANCVGDGPKKVGYFAPNGYQIFDMLGNVSEWVYDWYDPEYYKNSGNSVNPQGPSPKVYRVVRGGSWNQNNTIKLTSRGRFEPEKQSHEIGFRCARNAAQ